MEQKVPAVPNLYISVTVNYRDNYWYKLDLQRLRPVLMSWQYEYLPGSAAVALKSEIYLLGGVRCAKARDKLSYEPAVSDDVFRVNAKTSSSSFKSAPSMLNKRSNSNTYAALGDKIVHYGQCTSDDHQSHVMEIFDPSSDQWLGFSKQDVGLPRGLEWVVPDEPLVSDPENNRILIHFETKGLYAFYPNSFKWDCLYHNEKTCRPLGRSAVINNVLYCCLRYEGKPGYYMEALDVEDGLKPLEIVWPNGFVHNKFFLESTWMAPIDLGNGKLCLVAQFHDLVNQICYESDDDYYQYCKEDDYGYEEYQYYDVKTYMFMVSCLIWEVEKQHVKTQSGRLKTKLIFKTNFCFTFTFEDLICPSDQDVQVEHAFAILSS